jgi:hypothetical protein
MDAATQQGLADLAVRLALENWWCVFGGVAGMLFGYYRLPFASHKHKAWRTIFRMEVAGVAALFTALLMSVAVEAALYPKVVTIACVSALVGMATPPFYDFIWRPAIWPLIRTVFGKLIVKPVVEQLEQRGVKLDPESTLMKFVKKKP